MTRRFGKKWLVFIWLVFIFVLLSLVLWAEHGYVNSEAYLLSKHNAITYKEWSKISAEELADALEKGEFNPDQLVFRTAGKVLVMSPAIVAAARNKQKEHLLLLLEHGAQIDLTDLWGLEQTALHSAASNGNLEIMEILLGYGAPIEFVSKGFTALHFAALRGQPKAMEMLLEAGANPNARFESDNSIRNFTPLHFIFAGYNKGTKNKGTKVTNDEELKDAMALLVGKGADINAIDGLGDNIIHHLTARCKTDMIEYAVQMGANINQENETHGTPLLWALLTRDSVPALLEAGADPNYAAGGQLTPLKVAMFMINPAAVIQTLLDGGADINLDVGDGTALKHAKLRASGEYYEIYSDWFLVGERLSPNCPLAKADFAQKQSIEEWQEKGQEAVDMLLAHGAKDDGGVLDDEAIASLAVVLSGFQSQIGGINYGR